MKKVYTVYQTATFGIVVEADNEVDADLIANETALSEWSCVGTEIPEIYEGNEFETGEK